jgi:mRNA interferase MazF
MVDGIPMQGDIIKINLDPIVTIDYNARQFRYIETVSDAFLQRLLVTVGLVFQSNKAAG